MGRGRLISWVEGALLESVILKGRGFAGWKHCMGGDAEFGGLVAARGFDSSN
jgi:hypothetical protein